MIFAREAICVAVRLSHYLIRPVSTNVVESSKFGVLATDNKERDAGYIKGVIVTSLGEPAPVANIQPSLILSVEVIWQKNYRPC